MAMIDRKDIFYFDLIGNWDNVAYTSVEAEEKLHLVYESV